MSQRFILFEEWWNSAQAAYLRQREQAKFDYMVADLFGYNAVQIGLSKMDALQASRITHRFQLDVAAGGDVQADPLYLPFANQSMDLVVLPHALEFSAYPHQILREVERVLIPEGNLLISGFNPMSLWRIYHGYKQHRKQFLWHSKFVSQYRLQDWLSVLNCELHDYTSCCYVPPLAQQRWVPWFEPLESVGEKILPLGGVYFVHAVKRVHGMRLMTPCWQHDKTIGRVLRPATWRVSVEQEHF